MVVRMESYITMVYYRAIDVCGQTLFEDDADQDGKIDTSNWHSNIIKNPSSLKIMNLPYLRYETNNLLGIYLQYVYSCLYYNNSTGSDNFFIC